MIIVVFFFKLLGIIFFLFFFQAEDGIRDIGVTGVQTCALPIWPNRLETKTSTRHHADRRRIFSERLSAQIFSPTDGIGKTKVVHYETRTHGSAGGGGSESRPDFFDRNCLPKNSE